jgi:hypothetical protein
MLHGVVRGAYTFNHERLQQLNDRMYQRNFPSQELQTHFSPRSTPTRQCLFPMVDNHAPSEATIKKNPNYNVADQFNPGTYSPWSGYMTSVDDESRLRNQFHANQPAAQSKYIPSSSSDLYNYNIQQEIINAHRNQQSNLIEQPASNITIAQPYPRLFETPKFAPFDANEYGLGTNTFENHTRQQVRDLGLYAKQPKNK